MAKGYGFSCDICQKFEAVKDGEVVPYGWIVVKLPGNEHRDLCGDKCMVALGKARLGVGTSTTNKAKRPNKASDDLTAYLELHGVVGKAKGSAIGTHNRFHASIPNPDGCLVCKYAVEEFESNHASAT